MSRTRASRSRRHACIAAAAISLAAGALAACGDSNDADVPAPTESAFGTVAPVDNSAVIDRAPANTAEQLPVPGSSGPAVSVATGGTTGGSAPGATGP
jgi:hypothetical protein